MSDSDRIRTTTAIGAVVAVAIAGLLALAPGLRTYRAERRELAATRALVARLTEESGLAERRAREAETASAAAATELAARQARSAAAASGAAQGPRFRWTQLVKEFRARLAGRPDVDPAEFRLLTARDWLESALNADGADEERLKRVLSAMRYTAQKRLAEPLYEALKRWTEAHGTLPPDVSALLPLLPPNFDSATLTRFSLARTGALEPRDQPVLVENDSAFAPLRFTVDGWSINRSTSGDTAKADIGDDLEQLSRVLDEDATWFAGTLKGWMTALPQLMEQTVGQDGMDELGQDMKQAAARYWAEHGNTSPGTLADVVSYLQHHEKITAATKQVVASMLYVLDHEGAPVPDAAALRPYLEALQDTTAVLRQMKLTYDGNQVTWSYAFKH